MISSEHKRERGPHASVPDWALCVATLAVIAPANNYAALLFSFHPILMTAAFVCFMPLALTS
jgi:hypothetical protein